MLFVIFLNFALAIVFSWLSKVLRLYTGLDYLVDADIPSDGTFLAEFLLRIVSFRFTFFFLTIGVSISYILRVKAFNEDYKSWEKYFVIVFGIITGGYLIIIYNKSILLLDLIAFIFIAVYTAFVYGPFMIRSIKVARSVPEKVYKTAFYSLALMAISFIFVLIFQFIDRIYVVLGSPGYTPFYFMGMVAVVISILGAYLGYIRPGASEK
ncbi:MAG: hypothetical protein EU521_00110 [Promethearchaeota archaeon]|nr:MAG: hypothetical protein EU521_00110 [Candidatus Lokiarchaeota archaeon]